MMSLEDESPGGCQQLFRLGKGPEVVHAGQAVDDEDEDAVLVILVVVIVDVDGGGVLFFWNIEQDGLEEVDTEEVKEELGEEPVQPGEGGQGAAGPDRSEPEEEHHC